MKITKKQMISRLILRTAIGAIMIYSVTHVIPYIFVGVRMGIGLAVSIWVSR